MIPNKQPRGDRREEKLIPSQWGWLQTAIILFYNGILYNQRVFFYSYSTNAYSGFIVIRQYCNITDEMNPLKQCQDPQLLVLGYSQITHSYLR